MIWLPYIVMILIAAMAITCMGFVARIASNALAGAQAELYQMTEFAKDALRSGRVMAPTPDPEPPLTAWEQEQARKQELSLKADMHEVR